MLANDGRARVVDFGLAHTASLGGAREREGATGSVAGTPDWMAPEQWRGETPTDKVDVWALGVMVHELLSGEHPFGPCGSAAERRASVVGSTEPARRLDVDGVSPAVREVIARSLGRDPAGRPSAEAWCAALDEALAEGPGLGGEQSPYLGLAAFDELHAQAFFGREAEIEAFLERLRHAAVLPIVGPSGAGKSSFLSAGVIPRLRARERWTVISMRPGADPFVTLAHRLSAAARGATEPAKTLGDAGIADLAAELRATPTLLGLRLATIAAADHARVLLAVDQLEELFTHGVPEATVTSFLEMLATACDDPADPVRAVFTLRDDFLGRVPELRQLFVLKKLGVEELRRVIVGPLERTGYRFESPEIVEDILAEVGDVAAGLPLLQFACRALWDARDVERRLLLCESHRRLGGVAGALARHADACIAELGAGEQAVARQILLRLVAGTTTRRVVERAELLAGQGASAERVLDRLLTARLVAQRRPTGEGGALVEVVHESLLQGWEQLSRWIDESREERRLLEELDGAAALWDCRGRRPEETWGAEELLVARGRIRQLAVNVPPQVESFLSEGERRHAASRRRTRLRLVAGALVALVVTGGSVVVASEFRRQKLAAEEQAEALRLAGGNLGRVDLVLRPYDWVDGKPAPASAAELPELDVRFHAPEAGNVHRPGPEIPAEPGAHRAVAVGRSARGGAPRRGARRHGVRPRRRPRAHRGALRALVDPPPGAARLRRPRGRAED